MNCFLFIFCFLFCFFISSISRPLFFSLSLSPSFSLKIMTIPRKPFFFFFNWIQLYIIKSHFVWMSIFVSSFFPPPIFLLPYPFHTPTPATSSSQSPVSLCFIVFSFKTKKKKKINKFLRALAPYDRTKRILKNFTVTSTC